MPADDDAFDIDPRDFLATPDESPGVSTPGAAAGWSAAAGIASLERIEQELADVDLALARLDEGRYGLCETCGAMISDARLAEYAGERFCADHPANS